MNLILYIYMCFIYKINAFEIDDNKYKVRKGFKALRNVTETVSARSVISCVTQCAKTGRCTHANYWAQTCEFIDYESFGTAIEIETENDSEFIYPRSCDESVQCQNSATCISNETGFVCQCHYGFAGTECQHDCDTSLDGRCYKAYHESMPWHDARDTCNSDGGDLVTVCNAETNDMLKQIAQVHGWNHVWLGGSDEVQEGRWEWITSHCSFSFEDWHSDWRDEQPNDAYGRQDCIELMRWNSGVLEWNDEECADLNNFICEFV